MKESSWDKLHRAYRLIGDARTMLDVAWAEDDACRTPRMADAVNLLWRGHRKIAKEIEGYGKKPKTGKGE